MSRNRRDQCVVAGEKPGVDSKRRGGKPQNFLCMRGRGLAVLWRRCVAVFRNKSYCVLFTIILAHFRSLCVSGFLDDVILHTTARNRRCEKGGYSVTYRRGQHRLNTGTYI